MVEREAGIEDKSFRRHKGVRAKRGESIKKARPSYSSESDSNGTPALRKITQRLNLGSDISSDESVANSYDSGQYSIMSYQRNEGLKGEPGCRRLGSVLNAGDHGIGGFCENGELVQDNSSLPPDIHISKSSDNTVVIRIGTDHTQHTPSKQPEGRNNIRIPQIGASVPDGLCTVSLYVPYVDQEGMILV